MSNNVRGQLIPCYPSASTQAPVNLGWHIRYVGLASNKDVYLVCKDTEVRVWTVLAGSGYWESIVETKRQNRNLIDYEILCRLCPEVERLQSNPSVRRYNEVLVNYPRYYTYLDKT